MGLKTKKVPQSYFHLGKAPILFVSNPFFSKTTKIKKDDE